MNYLDQLLNRAEQLAGDLLEASDGRLTVVVMNGTEARKYGYAATRLTDGHVHDGGAHSGWRGHDGHAVHRHEMSTGRTQWELHRGDGSPVTTIEEQRERDGQDS